jgi:hypothetical protein
MMMMHFAMLDQVCPSALPCIQVESSVALEKM